MIGSLVLFGLVAQSMASATPAVPTSAPPSGCLNSQPGTIKLQLENVTNSVTTQDLGFGSADELRLTLYGGILKDQKNSVVFFNSDHIFAIGELESGSIYKGFSICPNGSIALGDSSIFYTCPSRNNTGFRLCDRRLADNCAQVYFQAVDAQGAAFSAAASAASKTSSLPLSTPTSIPPSVSPTAPPPNSGRISTGAKVGIGVGCGLPGIALLAAAVFFERLSWRRRHIREDEAAETVDEQPPPYTKELLPLHERPGLQKPSSM